MGPQSPSFLMEMAVATGDTDQFFTACRDAVRNRIALHFDCHPDSIDSDEAGQRLPGSGLPDLLEVAEVMIGSGIELGPEELARWQSRLVDELRVLRALR